MPLNINTSTLALFASGLTVAVPYVSAILTQKKFARWINETIVFAICILAGLVAFFQSGGNFSTVHDSATFFAIVPLIFAGAKIYYVKLGYQSPLIHWLEWCTGGFQAGIPAPISTLRMPNSEIDRLPVFPTDIHSSHSVSLPTVIHSTPEPETPAAEPQKNSQQVSATISEVTAEKVTTDTAVLVLPATETQSPGPILINTAALPLQTQETDEPVAQGETHAL
jgi:hypothetical protein